MANQSHLHVLTETDEEIDVAQRQQISEGSVLRLAFAGHDVAGHDVAVDSRMFETLGLRKKAIDLSISDYNFVIVITSFLMDGRRSGDGLGVYSSPGGYTMQDG